MNLSIAKMKITPLFIFIVILSCASFSSVKAQQVAHQCEFSDISFEQGERIVLSTSNSQKEVLLIVNKDDVDVLKFEKKEKLKFKKGKNRNSVGIQSFGPQLSFSIPKDARPKSIQAVCVDRTNAQAETALNPKHQ